MMWRSILMALLIGCSAMISACGSSDAKSTMYVLLSAESAPQFVNDLVSSAKELGLTANVGHATDDRGHVLTVIEAKNWKLRLWSENVLLSSHEDTEVCGTHVEAYSDPGQFIIYIKPRWPLQGDATSVELLAQFRLKLSKRGYDVRDTPAQCSALAKATTSR